MKNLQNTLAALLVMASLLFANNSFASTNPKDSASCLQLNGRVLKSFIKEKGMYTVELISENKVIESQTITSKKLFNFDLAKNSLYTLRISKEGFLPFIIEVNTELMEGNSNVYEFRFDTELTPLSVASNFEKNSQNEPSSLLKFDQTSDSFFPIEYNNHVSNVF